MEAAVFTAGPYIQMTIFKQTLMTPEMVSGVLTWRLPLGHSAVALIDLDDCGYYVKWLFDNTSRAAGTNLKIAIDHVSGKQLAEAFTKVTDKPAHHDKFNLEEYRRQPRLAAHAKEPSASESDLNDPAAMTFQENFSGFWNMWRASDSKNGVSKRDYVLLDEIFP